MQHEKLRAKQAESALIGAKPEEALFLKAGEIARQECTPIDDFRGAASYRKAMVGILTAGITLSMFFFGSVADRKGVRYTLILAFVFLLLGLFEGHHPRRQPPPLPHRRRGGPGRGQLG